MAPILNILSYGKNGIMTSSIQLNIIEPTLHNHTGHCHGYIASLLQASNTLFPQLGVIIWLAKKGKSLFDRQQIKPYFCYRLRKIQIFFLYKYLVQNDQHIFVPTAGMLDMVLLTKLLKKNPTFLGSIHLHFHQFRQKPKKLKKLKEIARNHPSLHIMTPTDCLASIFTKHGFKNVSIVPCPVYPPDTKNDTCIQEDLIDKVKLLYTGAARKDKGFIEVVDFVERSNHSIPIHIQAPKTHNGKYDKSLLPALKQLKKIKKNTLTVSYNALPQSEYLALFRDSITLLIYNVEAYKDKFSGVLLEALYYGSPVIVTKGTWFAQVVKQYNVGIIVESTDSLTIETAADTILNNYKDYKNRALKAGEILYQLHHPKNTLKNILDSIAC